MSRHRSWVRLYPDHPVPTWKEFCRDYRPHYFDGSRPEQGQCFVIVADRGDVGVVCHNERRANRSVDLDIWLRSEADCGRGFGPDALRTLADYLHREHAIERFLVAPSARNRRAIAAYRKAGFRELAPEYYPTLVGPEDMEYKDRIVLVKEYTSDRGSRRGEPSLHCR